MKFLCVCNHGNVRSVCLSRLLKDTRQHEAFAIGAQLFSEESIKYLIDWSDKVIVMCEGEKDREKMQNLAKDKYVLFDIGADRWFNPMHPELIEIIKNKLR